MFKYWKLGHNKSIWSKITFFLLVIIGIINVILLSKFWPENNRNIISQLDLSSSSNTVDDDDDDLFVNSKTESLFNKAQQCLKDSPFAPLDAPILWTQAQPLPMDELQAHFEDILNATSHLRFFPASKYASYSGPWIEDMWIKQFCCSRHVSEFGGLVPLFIQWNDLSKKRGDQGYANLTMELLSKLRKDVIYVTVSQNDDGIHPSARYGFRAQDTYNVLVLSAGGFGHIPLPLLIREQLWVARNKSAQYLITFAGSIRRLSYVRKGMSRALKDRNLNCSFPRKVYQGANWAQAMRDSMLNLAPRGFGRTSFRLYEAIQMGLIPIYLWDDDEWLPYRNSPASVKNFGFSIHIDSFRGWLESICQNLAKDKNYLRLDERTALMKRYRDSYYTFEAVLQQLEYFFRNDCRSDLVCQRHPATSSKMNWEP